MNAPVIGIARPGPVGRHPTCHKCGGDLYLRVDGWICFACEDRDRRVRPGGYAPGIDLTAFAGMARIDRRFAGHAEDAASEPRPTHEDSVEISPVAQAEWSGYQLGVGGQSVVGPAHYTPEESAAFRRGHEAGFKAYEDAEFDRWVTRQEQEAISEWPHPEMVEASGVHVARFVQPV